ncbi:MAG: UvrD-helicase domain-containing protein [Candidatus Bruticola sp.]
MDHSTSPAGNSSNAASGSHSQLLDSKARRRAVDTAGSFIVQAPAGSGKTSLLTMRFLALLGEVERPEEILAITFTNKAVGEMRERILSFLNMADKNIEPDNDFQKSSYEAARKALKQSEENHWDLLNNPSRLNIRTIDSFCGYIAQNLPISSGMGYVLETEADCRKYYTQAAVNAVNEILYGEAPSNLQAELKIVLSELDNNQSKLEEQLAEMLADRADLLSVLENNLENGNKDYASLYSEQFSNLRKNSEDSYRTWCRSFSADLEKMALKIDSDFYTIVVAAAQAICDHNGGTEFISNKQGSNPLVSAFVKLASSQEEGREALEQWEKWRCLSIILLNTDRNDFRKSIDARSLKLKDGNGKVLYNELESIKDKKAPYYENWDQFVNKQTGLLAECSICDQKQDFIEALKKAARFGSEYTEEEWAQIVRRLHIFAFAVKHLQDIFAQETKCDYSEISRAALKASDPYGEKGLDRFSFSSPIKHILVDEYQDTSWDQYELLTHLTAACNEAGNSIFTLLNGDKQTEGTIFCVGDPMQSIYRFRGADVSVYTYTKQVGLTSPNTDLVKLDECCLQLNFRSNKQLIDTLCNQVFANIFPKETSSSKGIVAFTPSQAAKCEQEAEPLIVRPLISSESLSDLAEKSAIYRGCFNSVNNLGQPFKLDCYQESLYEAKLMAEDIKRIRQTEKDAVCAVLLETKNIGDELLRELQAANIPVSQKDIQKLSQTKPVPLLTAITKVFLDPLDRTSWITILRSPLVGLTWAEICEIMERYLRDDNPKKPWSRPKEFWLALNECIKENKPSAENPPYPELYERCLNLKRIFSQAFFYRRAISLIRAVEGVWRSLGGPAFCGEAELKAAQQYFNFLTRYDSGSVWPTANVLDNDLNDLFADTMVSEGNPVQFMTIHSSKGLEFDYVFLPGLGRKSVKPSRSSFLSRAAVVYDVKKSDEVQACSCLVNNGHSQEQKSINDNVMIAAGNDMPIGEAISCIRHSFDTAERVRLFYVAATRAKKRLYIYTYIKIKLDTNNNCEVLPKQQGKVLNKDLLNQLSRYFVLGQNLGELYRYISVNCEFIRNYCANVMELCSEVANLANHEILSRLELNWAEKCGLQRCLDSCRKHEDDTKDYARRQIAKQAGGSCSLIDNNFKIMLGTIIHYAFEQLVGSELRRNFNSSSLTNHVQFVVETLKPILVRMCAQSLNKEQTEKALETASEAVKNIMLSERGRWILKRREIDGCEMEFYADNELLGGPSKEATAEPAHSSVEKRILDRVFIEDGTLWIIDYKTSSKKKHETLAEFYERKCCDYREQLSVYKRIAAQIYPEYQDKIRAALYFPLVEQGEGFCEIQS